MGSQILVASTAVLDIFSHVPLEIDTRIQPELRRMLVEFGRRWAVCFMVATGIALLSVSSVKLALFVLNSLVLLFGTPAVDGMIRSVV